jgi:hypothetical protein
MSCKVLAHSHHIPPPALSALPNRVFGIELASRCNKPGKPLMTLSLAQWADPRSYGGFFSFTR